MPRDLLDLVERDRQRRHGEDGVQVVATVVGDADGSRFALLGPGLQRQPLQSAATRNARKQKEWNGSSVRTPCCVLTTGACGPCADMKKRGRRRWLVIWKRRGPSGRLLPLVDRAAG